MARSGRIVCPRFPKWHAHTGAISMSPRCAVPSAYFDGNSWSGVAWARLAQRKAKCMTSHSVFFLLKRDPLACFDPVRSRSWSRLTVLLLWRAIFLQHLHFDALASQGGGAADESPKPCIRIVE